MGRWGCFSGTIRGMQQDLASLNYARPMPVPPRPPMYRLVITLLFAGLMVLLGLVAGVLFFTLLIQQHGSLFSIVPIMVAALFFYMGIRSSIVVVRFLRGKPPGEHWERWVFAIWSTWV